MKCCELVAIGTVDELLAEALFARNRDEQLSELDWRPFVAGVVFFGTETAHCEQRWNVVEIRRQEQLFGLSFLAAVLDHDLHDIYRMIQALERVSGEYTVSGVKLERTDSRHLTSKMEGSWRLAIEHCSTVEQQLHTRCVALDRRNDRTLMR